MTRKLNIGSLPPPNRSLSRRAFMLSGMASVAALSACQPKATQETAQLAAPEKAIAAPGSIIHEAGTARMGDDPDKSVVDVDGRCWDVDNLYVVDGGIMPTNPHKNLTITIMALAYKNADGLADRLAKGEL